MRDSFPSVTAMYVAFARGLATHDHELSHACFDPFAERLLPRRLAGVLRRADETRTGRALVASLRGLMLGMAEHIALRTALIDRALEQGVRSGVEQVVLLGAGFDARAHRLAALGAVDLFEVDHPSTQRLKIANAAGLPLAARTLRYVECDFERTPFQRALLGAGFDPSRRSAFVWEGVTMYLGQQALVGSIAAIAELACPASLLITTYLTPELAVASDALGRLGVKILGLLAEPVRFTAEPSELADLLARAGLEVLSDAAPKDAGPHFGVELPPFTPALPSERLVVAVRREKQT